MDNMNGMFCEKCGKIFALLHENEKIFGLCRCGFRKEIKDISHTQEIKQKEKIGEGSIRDENQLASYPHKCRKCGHIGAQVIEMGVWFSDESGVIRYKCGKCGAVEQEKDSNS